MGVDLSLLPFRQSASMAFSHSIIEVSRDYDLYKLIESVGRVPAPDDFRAYVAPLPNGERGYGVVKEDCYGQSLRMVSAKELAAITLPKDTGCRARAAWAYLKELPDDFYVVLFWH